jgi:hypothetical protein
MLLETDIPIKYKATVMQKLNILESMDSSDQEYYKKTGWIRLCVSRLCRYKNLSVNIDDGIDKCSEFIENSETFGRLCVWNERRKNPDSSTAGAVGFQPPLWVVIGIYGPPGTAKTTIVKKG